MEEADIRAPLYYILGREISQGDLEAAHSVFTITPCLTGIVSRHLDKALVRPFVYEVLRAYDDAECKSLAARISHVTHCPILTVGEGKDVTAVYPDGREEALCLCKLTDKS